MIGTFLSAIALGLIVGLIARAFIHTGRRFGCVGTILLGIVGSFVGGAIGSLISDDGLELDRANFLGSILGAVVVLLIIRFVDSKE